VIATAGFAPRFVLWWTRLYTRGLEHLVREDRYAEIASDVFEQCCAGGSRRGAHAALLGRCLLGVPADVSWRLEQSKLATLPARLLLALFHGFERPARWIGRHGLPRLTPAVAAVYGLLGLLVLASVAGSGSGDQGGTLFFAAWCLAAAGAMFAGWRRMPSRPTQGLVLVCLGGGPLGLMLTVTVVAPLVTAVVLWREAARWRALRRVPVSP